ncbi:MAG: glycosyltransferase [Fimbriimonas sp.]
MHVLIIPSWYYTKDKPFLGMFFKDQALALQRVGLQTGIVFNEGRSLQRLRPKALVESHFQTSFAEEDGLPTMRRHGWNTLAQTSTGGRMIARLTASLVGDYIKRCGRPDVIHAHSACWAGVAARMVKASHGIPYVVTEHTTAVQTGDLPAGHLKEALLSYEHAERILAVSNPLARKLQSLVPSRQIEIVPNLVDVKYWTLPPGPRSQAPFTFVTQALFHPRKAFDLLIKAFAAAFPDDPSVRLRIGGDGPLRGDLTQLAASLGVSDRVEMPGALKREGVRQSMWEGNCFVLPSLAENFGVVLIEALSTGLPLISTQCGGPEDILTPETGILLQPGDLDGLTNAMREARHRAWPDQATLRESAASRFSYEAVGGRLREIYGEIKEGGPAK